MVFSSTWISRKIKIIDENFVDEKTGAAGYLSQVDCFFTRLVCQPFCAKKISRNSFLKYSGFTKPEVNIKLEFAITYANPI